MVTAMIWPTLLGADDISHSAEKRSDGKAVTLRLGEAGGGATSLLTLTYVVGLVNHIRIGRFMVQNITG